MALSISIVIPAYNEALRLGQTLDEVLAYLRATTWDWEVRVVDDGSSDATAAVASHYHALEPRVVVHTEPHGGKGAAVKAGLLAARGEYRFICDADLSMPIQELSRFLPPTLDGADIAIGTREGKAARRIGEPVRRHLVGRVFNHLVRLLLLPGLHDTQCGFKMFTARAVSIVFPLVRVPGWSFDIEALYIARRHGLRVVEVPIEWHYRDDSRVRMLRDGRAMFLDLLRMRRSARLGMYDRPRPDGDR